MTDKLTEVVDRLVADVMSRITEAAKTHDLAAFETLTRVAAELKDIQNRVAHVSNKLERINGQQSPGVGKKASERKVQLRSFAVQVTEGAIRQNLLTMTEPLRRRLVQPNETFTIEALPSGERFKTILLASGNKLQERGAISRFYRDAHIKGGDHVLLAESSPGEWTLQKAPENFRNDLDFVV